MLKLLCVVIIVHGRIDCCPRLRQELAPATLELQETFALRRILLKHGQRTEVNSQADRLLQQWYDIIDICFPVLTRQHNGSSVDTVNERRHDLEG